VPGVAAIPGNIDMIEAVALVLLFASGPAPDEATAPPPVQQETPTDPFFDKPLVATDGPTFVLSTIESVRQGELDARAAADSLNNPTLRDAAQKIGRQNESTRVKLESLAKSKGWRLPGANPVRDTALTSAGEARTGANFVLQQISFHQATVAKFRAQIAGKGDADLNRALREALPGYQKNLALLLQLEL